MRAESTHRLGAEAEQEVGSLGDCAGGVDDVIDEHHILALDVADYGHLLNDVGLGALLVAEHEGHIEVFCIRVGTFRTSHIG